MALLQKLLPALLAAVLVGAGLLLVQRLLRQRKLPELPLRLSLLALLCWALLPLLNDLPVSAGYRPWLALLDELFLALAGLRVALWLLLELPAGLGWWRRPPELMLQLLMLGAGAVVTVIVVHELARVDLVGLLTTSAVLTAVLGLAAQETLKDLFAGLELQLGDDFSVGDWLELSDGARGIVETITWRDTMLLTLDGCRLVIPNSKITAELIINRSASGVISNRFEVGLDYDYPPDRALVMLESVARQNARVLGEPPAKACLKAFGESAITYELQVWQSESGDRAHLDLRSDLLSQIWYALERDGQRVPYPVREIQRRRPQEASARLQLPTPEACATALGHSDLFGILNQNQLELVIRLSRLMSFAPREAIVLEGAEGESLYQVLRGTLEVTKQMASGERVEVCQLGPGDVFGEMTLFTGSPRSATVRAVRECLLLRVSRDCMRTLLEQEPSLLERLALIVSTREAELNNLSLEPPQEANNALVESMKRLLLAWKKP
jgi:small-conductance mechanosensitive channel